MCLPTCLPTYLRGYTLPTRYVHVRTCTRKVCVHRHLRTRNYKYIRIQNMLYSNTYIYIIHMYESGLRIPGPPPHGMVPQAHALGNTGHGTIHTCMHAPIHPSIHTYLRTYVHTYTRTHVHACMHGCMHAWMHTYIHTYLHTNIPTYQHTYQHTNIHTNIPTYHHHRPQGGGPEEPYHHHRPQGGGPEEPYHHPRPQGGGPWGGRGRDGPLGTPRTQRTPRASLYVCMRMNACLYVFFYVCIYACMHLVCNYAWLCMICCFMLCNATYCKVMKCNVMLCYVCMYICINIHMYFHPCIKSIYKHKTCTCMFHRVLYFFTSGAVT